MIGIYFDPSKMSDVQKSHWEVLMKRAEDATVALVDSFESNFSEDEEPTIKFNQGLWRDIKAWMLKNIFYEKCAYCERLISGFTGDAEHYRPKGAIRYSVGKKAYENAYFDLPDTRRRLKHPGYFWLAYDWRNLVPACKFCNSGSGKNESFEVKAASRHRFVVEVKDEEASVLIASRSIKPSRWKGYYYLSPNQLDQIEDPLLLNPLNPAKDRDPGNHLIFGIKGTVAPLNGSEYGKATIEMFNLKTIDLLRKRQEAQEEFQDRFFDAMRSYREWRLGKNAAEKLLDEYRRGRYPFSASALGRYMLLKRMMAK